MVHFEETTLKGATPTPSGLSPPLFVRQTSVAFVGVPQSKIAAAAAAAAAEEDPI